MRPSATEPDSRSGTAFSPNPWTTKGLSQFGAYLQAKLEADLKALYAALDKVIDDKHAYDLSLIFELKEGLAEALKKEASATPSAQEAFAQLIKLHSQYLLQLANKEINPAKIYASINSELDVLLAEYAPDDHLELMKILVERGLSPFKINSSRKDSNFLEFRRTAFTDYATNVLKTPDVDVADIETYFHSLEESGKIFNPVILGDCLNDIQDRHLRSAEILLSYLELLKKVINFHPTANTSTTDIYLFCWLLCGRSRNVPRLIASTPELKANNSILELYKKILLGLVNVVIHGNRVIPEHKWAELVNGLGADSLLPAIHDCICATDLHFDLQLFSQPDFYQLQARTHADGGAGAASFPPATTTLTQALNPTDGGAGASSQSSTLAAHFRMSRFFNGLFRRNRRNADSTVTDDDREEGNARMRYPSQGNGGDNSL